MSSVPLQNRLDLQLEVELQQTSLIFVGNFCIILRIIILYIPSIYLCYCCERI